MSGEGFAAKRRSDKASEVKAKERARAGPPLMAALKEQAPAMTGMAMMFIVTILIAMSIQDFYDQDDLRAFGDSGTTKAGFILLELVFILIFTAGIIWLARRGLENLIRWGVLGVLWIAMLYTLIPLSYMLLVEDVPELTMDSHDVSNTYIISVDEGGAGFFVINESLGDHGSILYMTDAGAGEGPYAGASVLWTHEIMPNESVPMNHQISTTADGIILCENTRWVLLDNETGQELDSHGRDCQLGLRYEPIDDDWETCDGADDVAQDWAVMENRLEPIGHWNDNDEDYGECAGNDGSWVYEFPEGFEGRNILFVRDIGDSHFLIVSTQWAGMVAYPTGPSNTAGFGGNLTTTWETSLTGSERFTAATYGAAPGDELDDDEPILVLGTNEGAVTGWQIGQTGTVDEDSVFRMTLDDPVRGLLLADCCGEISNDLWVVEGDDLRIFMYGGLHEQSRSLTVDGENIVMLALHHPDESVMGGLLLIEHDGAWTSTIFVAHIPNYAFIVAGMGVMWADVLTIVVSVGLMVALLRFPEWYVVNTVGILVGAGVITILGVSFVPVLIMLFMVLAAGYDAWAVYRSKHMLELADTMIGLKLPILLVAPQDKEYSFIAEGDSVMAEKVGDEPADWKAVDDGSMPAPRPIKKGGGEAMFMGLGDVIFPGMLCISAMTFLPESSGPLGLATTTWVALCTMLGGLLGYFWLMTYVARGQPQAGLPLLNGGAILGYIVSASLFIGSGAFTFGISLF
ncbi:MAG TPA: hypothetical protein EYQ80_01100 [Candidatus Poseidoniales archaeon]|nr:hypothetical protein [Candidatus Poseidoniales archaeon]